MARIPDGWVEGSSAQMAEGAYLVYWYTDVNRGHEEDPDAYGTLKRWRRDAIERFGDDIVFVAVGRSREAWVPEEAL